MRGWRVHPALSGRPDFAWIGRRLAVFVDGAFWHGHPDYYWGQSGRFWDEKIERNRARDRQVDDELVERGWTVVRLWDFEVERDPDACVRTIEDAISTHHVLAIDYVNEDGREERLPVWPAFIRTSDAGHIVLWAMSPEMGHWVELRLDRVRGAQDTGEVFTPSW